MHHVSVFLHGDGTTCHRPSFVLAQTHGPCLEPKRPNRSQHRDVATGTDGLHESLGTRLGDSSEIAYELVVRHANTTILDRNCRIGLVRNEFDEEVWLGLDLHWDQR